MKKVFQNFKSGDIELLEVPVPKITENEVLIQTSLSLISLGTEKMLIDFAKSNLVRKAQKQPERVKQVLDKINSDGIIATYRTVKSKLDQLMPMGYSNCGVVLKVGKNVKEFVPGDRVISNGAHSEIVKVSKNLCCKIPSNVSDETAVFTVLGSIAMQGIRLANPTFSESFVVIGLGLIGILTAQILQANGCKVVGIDTNTDRLKVAKKLGITSIQQGLNVLSNKHIKEIVSNFGVDAVLICANTNSNEPIRQAASICRKKGRIVLVGSTGLNITRSDFYEKKSHFKYHAPMVQVGMIKIMKAKEMIIQSAMLDGQNKEILMQF